MVYATTLEGMKLSFSYSFIGLQETLRAHSSGYFLIRALGQSYGGVTLVD